MSQNHPFFFSAGPGYIPPTQAQQSHPLAMESSFQAPAVSPPSQHAASQQNAQVASMDMSALEGISPERLAAIARLFQSGALQMPPPAPSVSTQSSHTGLPPSNSVQPLSFDSQIQQPSTSAVRADVDMDTEEGEVDESEESSTHAKARDFLRPPPTGPRNRSLSPRERLQGRARQKLSPKRPVPSQTVNEIPESRHTRSNHVTASANGKRVISNHEAAKMFVLEIVNAGYSYEDILPDIRNPKSLTGMFRELGLPMSPPKVFNQSSQPNAMATMTSQSQASNAKPAPTEETRKTSLTKRAAPAKPAPIDRSEYLARLQAAKNKKTESATASSEPQERVTGLEPLEGVKTAAQGTKPSQPSTSGAPTSGGSRLPPGKAASMTELARRKLEALKAQQAAKQSNNAAPSLVTKPPYVDVNQESILSPSQSGLGAGLADIPSQVAQGTTSHQPPVLNVDVEPHNTAVTQTTVSPTPQTPSHSFSSLPGLFMFDNLPNTQLSVSPQPSQLASTTAVQSSGFGNDHLTQAKPASSGVQNIVESTTASPAPLSVPRKRPVAADFDDIPLKPVSAKRPFGQSRNASEDESLVIQVSDDEDDDEAMDIEPIAEPSRPVLQTKSFRDVGPLRDFPPKSNIYAQPSAPTTPGGVTYEQKMKEIEDIKRMIAEKERRQKGNGKSTPVKPDGLVRVTSSPVATGNVADSNTISPSKTLASTVESMPHAMDGSPADSLAQGMPQTAAPIHPRPTSVDRPKSAVQLAKEREKEILRKRLLELENEVEDLSEPAEAPETRADQEYAMSGALPDTETSVVAAEAASSPQTEEEVIAPERVDNRSASEEGEVSDDSMSKFYNLEGSNDGQSQLAPNLNNDRTGSQASTASPSNSEMELKQAETRESLTSRIHRALSPENNMAEGATLHANIPTEVEFQRPEAAWEDAEMTEDLHDPAAAVAQEESDGDKSMEDDESEDDSGGEDSDVDDFEELIYTQTGETGAQDILSTVATESHLNGTESSSPASSADAQDPGPETSILEPGRNDPKEETVADDLAPELQPSHEEVALPADQVPAKPERSFTPYRSPLAAFKDYRYHPEYLSTVSGGYKSITYSHNIDPENPLCPFETAGGKCNDSSCQFQHFKSMFVSDTELIKNMGLKSIPAHGPEEAKRWSDGLGTVIRELRDTNLDKDANVIAARIVQFRREFVGDPTKILNLG